MIIEYNGNNFIETGILYFYSSWVSSCNIQKENFEFIKDKYKNINILKINTTKYYMLKKDYNIKVIPSFVILKNKEIISKIDGMSNKITINKWINNYFNQ